MVVLVNGSPREKGCTCRALSEIASVLEGEGLETRIIHASSDPASIAADAELIEKAEGLIVGSPVYYASPSGLSVSYLDEIFNRISGKVRLKPAAAIVSCRRGGASASFDVLNKYFSISEMLIVSSNYWNQVHGNTPEEVEQDLEGLQTMRVLGRNMAYVIKAIKAADLPLPEKESKVRTNYIR